MNRWNYSDEKAAKHTSFFSIVLFFLVSFWKAFYGLYVYMDYLSVETNGINGRRLRRGSLFEKLSTKWEYKMF